MKILRMFFVVLCVLFVEVSLVFAVTAIPQSIIDKIKANPALLDTPQGRAILSEYGLTKEEALALIKGGGEKGPAVSTETVTQKILEEKKAAIPQSIIEQIKENPALLDTPQGRAILSEYGLTKEEALALIKEKSEKIPTVSAEKFVEEKKVIEPHPFTYIKEDEIVSKTKELQQRLLVEKGLPRFGFNFFANANTFNPLAFPTPDYYILTPGDTLAVQLFGSTNQSYEFTIDNNGNIMIPVIGPVHVGGEEYGKIKKNLALTMEKTFPNSKAVVRMKRFSTIQVILTGEAKAPGIYNLPSLSTVQTLLVQAGGVLPTGSLRDIEVYRDGKLIDRVDLYNLLTGHPPEKETLLKAGDVVHINRVQKEVKIYGEVKRPAIYELKKEENAKELLHFAGGLTAKASRDYIVVKRYDEHKSLKDIVLNLKEFMDFKLKDGDEVIVYPIDSLKKGNVYLFGNVIKPGPRALEEGTTLHTLLKKEAPDSFDEIFLPDTFLSYGYIKRRLPDMQEKIISFNPLNVYNNKEDIPLKKDDEIYFLNRFEVMSLPYVSISGQVLKPGLYRYFEGMKLEDIVKIAGIKRLADKNIQITTYATEDYLPKTIIVNLDEQPDFKLNPYDEIYLFDYYKVHKIRRVTIQGEVNKPGTYAIDEKTTLQDIINVAGGLTDKASDKGEIVRYYIKDGERKKRIIRFDLNKDAKRLHVKDYDIITVFRIPKWSEQKVVTLKGEVRYPGTYVITEGETLADVLERAGGFTDTAFIEGAVFTRKSVRELQQRQLEKALSRLKKNALIVSAEPREMGQAQLSIGEFLTGINQLIEEAEKYKPIGRITIKLKRDLEEFRKSSYNIVLEDGDTLYVPTRIDTVSVVGEVLNPNAIIYDRNLSPWDYIERAGGLTDNANKDQIYIVHANGEAERLPAGTFFISGPEIRPGDTIVVPIYIKTYSNMQFAKDATQIIYQLAVSIAALNTIGVF